MRSDGAVWAWGNNRWGALGDGTTTDRSWPAPVPGLDGVVAVAAGISHSVALRSDGAVWEWAHGEHGEFGGGTTTYASLLPRQTRNLGPVRLLAAGRTHVLVAEGS